MIYNERNRRANRDAVTREQAHIRSQRNTATPARAPRVIKPADPRHIDNRTAPTAPDAPAPDAVAATRKAFDRTRADLDARRASESANILRALRA